MAKKDPVLKTKRLALTPMTEEELRTLIGQTSDEGLKQAYGEMLAGCEANPAQRLWHTAWKLRIRQSGETVGSAGFRGAQTDGAVELGYGVDSGFEGMGYATEAAKALINWAFSQKNVYFIEAETTSDHLASLRVLQKLKFQPGGSGAEGPRFLLEKSASVWRLVYLFIGMALGMCIGAANGQLAMGMGIGLAVGLYVGLWIDGADKKKREKLRERRMREGGLHDA